MNMRKVLAVGAAISALAALSLSSASASTFASFLRNTGGITLTAGVMNINQQVFFNYNDDGALTAGLVAPYRPTDPAVAAIFTASGNLTGTANSSGGVISQGLDVVSFQITVFGGVDN